ncbi:hypothetical protein HS048_27655 [Planomonospora sp. ID91781]|uniref:hypothetical protein n=1 Tax=Planomonospora sp. ID91781 TaxID=2738135 RepID=UPI0018C3B727|nr:hypothetical protein [Planomonospora sp. ID91781]MBG0824489.1 hypothetical protein [Planomonospora sp. ID91781]
MLRRRSPQEKKRLSYAKDRRNDYGENDKGSRKNIRRSKRAPHRANRHRAHQVLEAAVGAVDEGAAEKVEQRLLVKRPKSWEKSPDAPLGEIVQYTLRRRMTLETGDPKRDAARLERVRQRTRQSVG